MGKKSKENTKLDWKQYIPIYGIHQIMKDIENNRPIIVNEDNPLTYVYFGLYHGGSIGAIITPFLLSGIEKFLY